MIRISAVLQEVRDIIDEKTKAGQVFSDSQLNSLGLLLFYCQAEISLMEERLAGSEATFSAMGNVVSLAAFMARRTRTPVQTPKN